MQQKNTGSSCTFHFLKLKSALWENNLFPFLLDMKEIYFDIVLLMLFLCFYMDILLILSLYLLLRIGVHLTVQCVCATVSQCVCISESVGIRTVCLCLNGLMCVCSVCMG